MTVIARVYLVRHGETDENRNGVIQGQLDTALNAVGVEQAKWVSEALRSVSIDIAFSSDLGRATHTAEAILKHHPEVREYRLQEELRERHMGDMQGKTMQTSLLAGGPNRRESGESGPLFAARAESWWRKWIVEGTQALPARDEPYSILVATHGGFIGVLVRSLLQGRKMRCAQGVAVDRCLNCSVTIVEVDDGGEGLVVQYGDVGHLKGMKEGAVENNADEAG